MYLLKLFYSIDNHKNCFHTVTTANRAQIISNWHTLTHTCKRTHTNIYRYTRLTHRLWNSHTVAHIPIYKTHTSFQSTHAYTLKQKNTHRVTCDGRSRATPHVIKSFVGMSQLDMDTRNIVYACACMRMRVCMYLFMSVRVIEWDGEDGLENWTLQKGNE